MPDSPPACEARSRGLVFIYGLFFLSGISGLVYQVVWLRMLIRALGCSVYATSIVVASFMAGLALGSYLAGRWADRRGNSLRLYAWLEIGIGVSALLILQAFGYSVPFFRFLHGATQGNAAALTVLQSTALFLVLLPATSLMGATLPVLAAHTRLYGAEMASRVKRLYGLNTLGATLGVLFAGFYSLGELGETATVWIGAALNLLVGLLALSLARSPGHRAGPDGAAPAEPGPGAGEPRVSPYPAHVRRAVLLAYGLSGFVALGYEIIWTRMLQIHLATSVYAFSAMLAWYLVGIAAGSLWGRVPDRLSRSPLALFGLVQLLLAACGLAGAYIFSLFGVNPATVNLTDYLDDMVVTPPLIVLPLTFLMGYLFPVAARCYVSGDNRTGEDLGRLYAVNTLGGIAGSLATGFLLIALLGTRGTLLFLVALSAATGVWALRKDPGRLQTPAWLVPCLLGGMAALGFLAPDPFLGAVSRSLQAAATQGAAPLRIYWHREATAATTTVAGNDQLPLERQLWVNGNGMTRLCIETKIMAHLPLILHPRPRKILVACVGMGTTLRSAWRHPGLECHAVELVPEVFESLPYFHRDAPAMLADPRVHPHVGDARQLLLTTRDEFDVITMDPPPPFWSSGIANLYSREYFELVRERLTDDGVLCAWIMPAELSETRIIMKSFLHVFPQAEVWKGPEYQGLMLIGYKGTRRHDWDRFAERERQAAVVSDLQEWGTPPGLPSSLRGLMVLGPEEFAEFVQGAPELTDDRPYTEFPLWRSLLDPTYRYMDARVLEAWRILSFPGAPPPWSR